MSFGTPSSTQWVDEELEVCEPLWKGLRAIKKNGFGDPTRLRHASRLLPSLNETLQRAKPIEEITTRINWKDLEGWIETAKRTLREDAEVLYNVVTTLGIDPSGLSIADALEKMKTVPPVLRRLVGSNGLQLKGVLSDPSSATTIPADTFWTSVLKVIGEIKKGWETLQCEMDNGSLAEFRRKWGQLTPQAKHAWLKKCYPELPGTSHPDLYACVNNADNADGGTRRSTFLMALINIDDLSEAENLPRILEMRAKFHPKLFRTVEGRAVHLGIWSKRINKIPAPGRLLFGSPGEGASDCRRNSAASQFYTNSEFDISFEPDYDPYDQRLDSEPAFLGFYQLQALKDTYKFLSSCAQRFLSDSETNPGIPSTIVLDKSPNAPSKENVPLLVRSSRLDYNGHPKILDLEYLVGLVQDSLDEMQHDLWQLRQDGELWQNRLTETSARKPGLVSNLLLALFSRIDTFNALSQHLQDILERRDRLTVPDAPPSTLLEDREALLLVASFHDELQAGFEEGVNRLQNTTWSPGGRFTATFTRLFNMIVEDDPVLKAMGLPAVMKTLDTELGKTPGSIPLAVSQALNDLSILAVCLRETDKHYYFLSYDQLINLANTAEERKKQGRPWLSVARRVLDTLGDEARRKLQDKLRDKSIDHCTFWNLIDNHMMRLREVELKAVVDEIQRAAPIDDAKRAESPPLAPFASKGDAHRPTQTQVKQSKLKHPHQALTFTTVPLPPKPPSTRTLPEIMPKKHIKFWAALQTQGSGGSFRWSEFCDAMEGIGCTMTPMAGASRRFRWEDADRERSFTIVFHEPHPNDKLTHRQARSWWLRKLQDKFTLVVEQ